MVFIPSFLPHKASKPIHRFVSLGENCEFGFVQRKLRYKKGGVLRWAFTKPEAVIKLLQEDFEGLYAFQNLEGRPYGMIEDTHFGLQFHSKIESEDGVFTQPESKRRAIHEKEIGKVAYLLNRMRSDLADPDKIFVYKAKAGIDDDFIARLRSSMDLHGGANLLIVREGGKPFVRMVREGLMVGSISQFADYSTAHKARYKEWFKIVELAATLS